MEQKWISFIMSTLVMLVAGTLYGFSAYSNELKEALDRTSVDVIGSCGDFGVYSGFLFGMFNDKYGPQKAFPIATFFLSGGYLLCWLMLDGFIPINYTAFCVIYFFIGQGSFGFFITVFSANNKNFDPSHRAKVIGWFLSWYSLSSMVFTLIYSAMDNDINAWFGLVWPSILVMGVLGGIFVREVDHDAEENQEHNLLAYQQEGELVQAPPKEIISQVDVDITGLDLFKSVDFWLIWFTFFMATGPCLMWKNIIGSVTTSFGLSSAFLNGQIYAWSIFNAIFRLSIGFIADHYASLPVKDRIARPYWMVIAGLLAAIINYCYLAGGEGMIWPITIFDAGIYGVAFNIIATELTFYFGKAHFGFNMGMVSLAPAVSGLLYTSVSAGSTAALIIDGDDDCLGAVCYNLTLILGGTTLLVATGLSYWMARRSTRAHQEELISPKVQYSALDTRE